jgi:hypothetical protein
MGNPFGLSDRPRSGALADAAERLGRVASIVKDQQLAHNQSGTRQPESEAFVLSPEEAWSRKYMIQCVGPVCTIQPTDTTALLLPRFAPAPAVAQAAAPSVELAPMRPAKPAMTGKTTRKAAAEPIGLAIGKPVRKRSLLRRLFRS